ncbi:MAG: haloacid dehalogenase type II [Wenzhouxiangellaceae bacterium]|nr:haloacid dehalogenase type II [Wenzhouxiangellaceae bacterium]
MNQEHQKPVIAFDIYGTLIDTEGVFDTLREVAGDKAAALSQTWRDKQLEYSFRRGLMQRYEPFPVCTAQALEYACAVHGVELSDDDRNRLMGVYRELPAFDDAADALAELGRTGYRCFAFSNGTREAVEELLEHAGIDDAFEGVVSCDEVRTFKPNPAVYVHFLETAGVAAGDAWLVSGNPFDIIGARAAGLEAAWVDRGGDKVFDPWGIEPTVTIASLTELPAVLREG